MVRGGRLELESAPGLDRRLAEGCTLRKRSVHRSIARRNGEDWRGVGEGEEEEGRQAAVSNAWMQETGALGVGVLLEVFQERGFHNGTSWSILSKG